MARKVVNLDEFWKMLQDCCDEPYRASSAGEWWTIKYKGLTYYRFPTGAHGHRRDAEVFAGPVRQLVTHFGIEECAEKHMPGLLPKFKKKK